MVLVIVQLAALVASAVVVAVAVFVVVGHLAQVERAEVDELVRVELAAHARQHVRTVVDAADLVPHLQRRVRLDEVHLVKDDAVGEHDLLKRFVGRRRGVPCGVLRLAEARQHVLCVDERDDAVESEAIGDVGRLDERAHDGDGIGHAGRLDQHRVEVVARLDSGEDGGEGAEDIATHGAAHTAVVHHNHLLGRTQLRGEQLVVDGHLAELVLNHSDLLVALLVEQMVEERGLPGAQEPGEDRDWDLLLVLNVRPRSMSAVPMLMLFGRVAVVVVWIVALAACMLMIMPMAVPVHIHWATFPTMCPAVAMAVAIAMGVSIRGNGCTGGCREHHDHIACCKILLNQLVRWQKPLARSIEKQW
mmetsp:Transcript_15816/g.33795  ORF Transcript_15816/g.33795 Transcript_15816/m.33795 type:complete len:361 (+) Transcript_15816:75-1157(+)